MRKHLRGRALVRSLLLLALLGLWFVTVASIGDDVIGGAWHHIEDQAGILARRPWFVGVTAGLLSLVVLGWGILPLRCARRADPVVPSDASNGAAT